MYKTFKKYPDIPYRVTMLMRKQYSDKALSNSFKPGDETEILIEAIKKGHEIQGKEFKEEILDQIEGTLDDVTDLVLEMFFGGKVTGEIKPG
jgi:DNA-directed RNA polymerase specialized sigma subunit